MRRNTWPCDTCKHTKDAKMLFSNHLFKGKWQCPDKFRMSQKTVINCKHPSLQAAVRVYIAGSGLGFLLLASYLGNLFVPLDQHLPFLPQPAFTYEFNFFSVPSPTVFVFLSLLGLFQLA